MQVENILQSKGRTVHTVEAGAPLAEAVRVLNQHKIGAVVVIDAKGKVAGILSERDIVRHLGDDPAQLLASPVRLAMTAKVITTTRQAAIGELMELMTRYRIRHIPVARGLRPRRHRLDRRRGEAQDRGNRTGSPRPQGIHRFLTRETPPGAPPLP